MSSLKEIHAQFTRGSKPIRRAYESALADLRSDYYDDVVQFLRARLDWVFEEEDIKALQVELSDGCYNDEEYYYGAECIRFLDHDEDSIDVDYEQFYSPVNVIFKASAGLLQDLIGNATVKLAKTYYQIDQAGGD